MADPEATLADLDAMIQGDPDALVRVGGVITDASVATLQYRQQAEALQNERAQLARARQEHELAAANLKILSRLQREYPDVLNPDRDPEAFRLALKWQGELAAQEPQLSFEVTTRSAAEAVQKKLGPLDERDNPAYFAQRRSRLDPFEAKAGQQENQLEYEPDEMDQEVQEAHRNVQDLISERQKQQRELSAAAVARRDRRR